MRLRFNYFTPTRKTFYEVDDNGNRKRRYDEPKTPYQRVLDCPEITEYTRKKLTAEFNTLDVAVLTRKITKLMEKLDELAGGKPESQDYGNNHKKQSVRRKGQKVI
jgi:hypothetical protein